MPDFTSADQIKHTAAQHLTGSNNKTWRKAPDRCVIKM